MAEYIKKEAALEIINSLNIASALYAGRKIINLPPADVAPVRHGRWLPFHSTAAGDIQYCSACEIGCTWKPNYCPNCGAKMMEG